MKRLLVAALLILLPAFSHALLRREGHTPILHSVLDHTGPQTTPSEGPAIYFNGCVSASPFPGRHSRLPLTGEERRIHKHRVGMVLLGIGAAVLGTGVGLIIYGTNEGNRQYAATGKSYTFTGIVLPAFALSLASLGFLIPGTVLALKYERPGRW